LPRPAPAERRSDEEIVHNGAQAAVRHAIAKRHHHVSDVFGIRLDKPDVPQPFVGQQRGERLRSAPEVQRIGRIGIKLGHHCDQVWNVNQRGFSHGVKCGQSTQTRALLDFILLLPFKRGAATSEENCTRKAAIGLFGYALFIALVR
jgi:hypothetical protein